MGRFAVFVVAILEFALNPISAELGAGQLTGTFAGDDITYIMPAGWFMQPVYGSGPEVIAHYSFYRGGLPYCELYVSCEILSASKSLDQAFADAVERAKPALAFYQPRGTQRTRIAGEDAIVHEFSYYMVQSVAFTGRVYAFIVNGKLYAFLFNTTSSNFGMVQGLFPQVIDSVRINPKPAPAAVPETPAKPLTETAPPPAQPQGQAQTQIQVQTPPEKKAAEKLPSLTAEPAPESAPRSVVFTDPEGRMRIPLPEGAAIFRQDGKLTSYKVRSRKAYLQIWLMESPKAALGMEAYSAEQRQAKPKEKTRYWVIGGWEAAVKIYSGKNSVNDDATFVTAVFPEQGLFILIEIPPDGLEASWPWIKDLLEGVRFFKKF
jgi:hypothetical protein